MKIGNRIVLDDAKILSMVFDETDDKTGDGTLNIVFSGSDETFVYDITGEEWEEAINQIV